MNWHEKLCKLIEKYGQATLALFLGVSQATISYWLNGQRVPRIHHIKLIMGLK